MSDKEHPNNMQSPSSKSVKGASTKSNIGSPAKSVGNASTGTFEINAIKQQILEQNKVRREREEKIEARKMADIIREFVDQAKEAKKMEEIRKSLQQKRKETEAERS